MIYPPVFKVCSADAGVQAVLGNPCRLYLFGHGTGDDGAVPEKPYAVWQIVTGNPENYLGEVPDADGWTVQVDIYATTANRAREVAMALRAAIEPVAYVVSWRGESRDTETKDYRFGFDVDWIADRELSS